MKSGKKTIRGAVLWVRRYLPVLLLVAYVLSAVFPTFGLTLRKPLTDAFNFSGVHLMLASLLFTLGLSIPLGELAKFHDAWHWLGAHLSIRLLAVVLLASLSRTVSPELWGPMIGLMLVASAPTAASSSGWSLQMKANKSLTAILILGTTILSFLVVPCFLRLAMLLIADNVGLAVSRVGDGFTPAFVLPWILCPTMVGMAIRAFAPRKAVIVRRVGHHCNPFVLLLLNYSNGATSLSRVLELVQPTTAMMMVCGASVLFFLLFQSSSWATRVLREEKPSRDSFVIGTAMSNTGLVLVVATLALPDRVDVHLPIIFYTFVQHIGVAMMGRSKSVVA